MLQRVWIVHPPVKIMHIFVALIIKCVQIVQKHVAIA